MKKLVILMLVLSQTGYAMTLEEYLTQVKKKNRIYTSTDLAVEAARDRQDAGDIELAPTVSASYLRTEDKSLPSQTAQERKISDYTLGVSKKFSTGTSVSLTGKSTLNNYEVPNAGTNPETSNSSLGVSLSQSLWKNSFGSATRIRHEREQAINLTETLSLDLQRRGVLIEAESSFWDYVVAQEDLKLKEENLERAKKLDRWTSGRVNNGISDRSDLMNVKALMSLRELELQNARDQLRTEEVRLRQNLDLADGEATPQLDGNLAQPRPYVEQLLKQKNVISIEAYLSVLQAKSKKLVAEEVVDSFKPDLSLVGGYTTTAYDASGHDSLNDVTKSDYPRSYVGLNFTWLFDTSAKKAQVSSYNKDALVAQYTAEKKQAEGKTAWAEHLRKFKVAQESVKTLEKIADYQKQRVKAEQDKFSKGRTITTNVVTAETDSAEADVKYLKAKSGLKKLEASTLLFTAIQE
jgi:outer membrane protein TolC